MGGKEGGRGYLYQGIVAVLEALRRNDWDRIYIEFPTEGDKVDIALKSADTITDAIQVKSTVNSFSKGDISKWLKDIITDYPCQRYCLVLIGNCAVSAVDFMNAITKFQTGKLDATGKKQLEKFETQLLKDINVDFKVLPFDPDSLKSLVREALWKYAYDSGHSLEHPQVSLLVDAMVEEELLQSTKDGYTDRTIFSLELNKRIELIIKKYPKVRKAIGILCFSRGSERLTQETSILLDLQDKFEGRFLKPDFDWTVDIGKPVQDFLRENTEVQQAYQIMLEAHGSIAFAAGRVFDTKSGVDICPVQKTILGPEIWEFDKCDRTQYQNWKVEHIARDEDTFDTALILNVRHNICSDVERYLKEQGVHVGRIINFSPEDTGSTGFSIQNGTHSSKLAMEVYAALAGRSTVERRAYLHIFAAAPNAFMFHLGQVSRPFGKCILYEYDFEQRGNCSYIPSIQFDGKGGLE